MIYIRVRTGALDRPAAKLTGERRIAPLPKIGKRRDPQRKDSAFMQVERTQQI
jgi:hypothetical protein